MKLVRKMICMLLVAMFLITSITATDVITPGRIAVELPELIEPKNDINHCYFEVDNVKGYWVERWYSNSLMDAYFMVKSNQTSRISGTNLRTTLPTGYSHTHLGSLSNSTNIDPGSSKKRYDDLSSLNAAYDLDWDNAILVIDVPEPEFSVAAYPYDYYWVYTDASADFYGDLVCN